MQVARAGRRPGSRCRTMPIGRSPRTACLGRGDRARPRRWSPAPRCPGNSTSYAPAPAAARRPAGSWCPRVRCRYRVGRPSALSGSTSLRKVKVRQPSSPCAGPARSGPPAARSAARSAVGHLEAPDHPAPRGTGSVRSPVTRAAHWPSMPTWSCSGVHPRRATWIHSSPSVSSAFDRRFPAGGALGSPGSERAAVHPLGLVERRQGLGPHPVPHIARHPPAPPATPVLAWGLERAGFQGRTVMARSSLCCCRARLRAIQIVAGAPGPAGTHRARRCDELIRPRRLPRARTHPAAQSCSTRGTGDR